MMSAVRRLISRIVLKIYVIHPLSRLWWLFLICFVMWTLLAVIVIRLRREKFWRICCGILSVLFVAILVHITVVSRGETANRELILRPFFSFYLARTMNWDFYREMLMNVFLFFPLGLMLPFGLSGWKRPVLRAVLIGLLISVCIETIQYFFALGWPETDDVIMNTLGVLAGSLSFGTTKFLMRNVRGDAIRDAD